MEEKVMHIDWEACTKEEISKRTDYGLYQIYGRHILYGQEVLLYIGQTKNQSFAERIEQHEKIWLNDIDQGESKFYIGKLYYYDKDKRYKPYRRNSKEIDWAEQLLIYVFQPAYNTKGKGDLTSEFIKKLHILNYYEYRDLLPEVSGARWTDLFPDD